METTDETAGAGEFWEQHYGQRAQIWSGRPNAQLVHFAAPLAPGRALDLGCGEGADAVWLAEQGWRVTAVDISEVALGRARVAAAGRGVADLIDFSRHDLTDTFPQGSFDLVTAQFLQSPLEFPREVVLRSAAAAVAPGGRLLIVEHGEAPPWSGLRHHHVHFPTPQETLDALRVDETWSCEHLGRLERAATSPDGEPALLVDNVLLLRRDA
ncbi:MAG: class I SAM-dependent methyltransferase [Propionibacteriaceae bacterium]|nr:class I SAM-dependent methyltransferase [Propionibacteriaceae bacterium]